MRLQDRKWKEFSIGEIFTIEKVLGRKITEYNNGKYYYISGKNTKNGLLGFVDAPQSDINKGNCIAIDPITATAYYQAKPFVGRGFSGASINLIYNENLNEYNALFICSVLKLDEYKYSYARLLNGTKLCSHKIQLPVTADKAPDWQFMEDYIKSLEPKADISELLELVGDDEPKLLTWFIEQDIDISEFKEYLKADSGQAIPATPLKLTDRKWSIFKVRDFFSVTRGSRIVKNKDFTEDITDKNIYPVITAKTTNNGIDGYYREKNCEGKCIVVCGEASGMYPTYQENPCWLLDTVREIKPKIDTFNSHIALFIMTLLRQEMYKYDFTRKAKPSDILETALYLPVTRNKAPDWQFMEDYIKSLPITRKQGRSISHPVTQIHCVTANC